MPESDLASSDPYSALPLDPAKQQIRLLTVTRSSSGPIKCNLEIFDLDSAPQYTALSYRWGSANADHLISINGWTTRISTNLFYFLEAYRVEDAVEYLWIDQLCIAQSDVKERNHQVGLMSKIYSQCQRTIVWLCDDQDHYPVIAEEFNRTHTKKALVGLLNDSYFTRLWIVQEVLLSSNIWVFTSGNVWIPWHNIRDCFLTKAWGREHSIHRALFAPGHIFREAGRILGTCILTFSGQGCEKPEDRVYGLLGIVPESERLTVDYDRLIDELYLDVIIAVGPQDRNECAQRLGDLFRIPSERREQLLAFLDFVQPVYPTRQIAALRDCSPTTPDGSGLVTSVGLVFLEQPPNRPRGDYTSAQWAFPEIQDPRDSSRTNAIDEMDGHELMYEAHTASSHGSPDTGPLFDPMQAILDFHYCLHEISWENKEFGIVDQDWQIQMDVVQQVFWTYVAPKKREFRPRHAGPLKYQVRWCYGYQGHVYEYAKRPKWTSLIDFRPDTYLMQYILQACSKVRSVTYDKPSKTMQERATHWVRRKHRETDTISLLGRTTCLKSLQSEECWANCAIDRRLWPACYWDHFWGRFWNSRPAGTLTFTSNKFSMSKKFSMFSTER